MVPIFRTAGLSYHLEDAADLHPKQKYSKNRQKKSKNEHKIKKPLLSHIACRILMITRGSLEHIKHISSKGERIMDSFIKEIQDQIKIKRTEKTCQDDSPEYINSRLPNGYRDLPH